MINPIETAIADTEMYMNHECELSRDNFMATIDTLIDAKAWMKEVALVTCVIRENDLIQQTLFQSFDTMYKVAEAFVRKYGIDNKWVFKMDFEEEVISFTKTYLDEQNNQED